MSQHFRYSEGITRKALLGFSHTMTQRGCTLASRALQVATEVTEREREQVERGLRPARGWPDRVCQCSARHV